MTASEWNGVPVQDDCPFGIRYIEIFTIKMRKLDESCEETAPCCQKVYACRICHDDSETHVLDRHKVQEIRCSMCQEKQEVGSHCTSCGTEFGRYFCSVCRLYDDVDKKQFHCAKCGLCRVGGQDNFFHCDVCDLCLHIDLKDNHKCIEKVSRANCPVCLEDLHSSRLQNHLPPCGHILHRVCFTNMLKTGNYACPLCSLSMVNMNNIWENMDEEVKNTPMPEEYRNFHVQILCRDCHKESNIVFHVIGLKCQHCGSYNTCRTEQPSDAQSAENVQS